jgi:formate dehydrogenase maturation protein FdhE
MNYADLSIIPLRLAVLCCDCVSVTNAVGSYCPVCGSPSLISMIRVLDREVKEIEPAVERALEMWQA